MTDKRLPKKLLAVLDLMPYVITGAAVFGIVLITGLYIH